MTKDEYRQKCIEAVEDTGLRLGLMINEEDAQRIFDALHGLVYVNPIEATEEMIDAGVDCGDWGPGIDCDGSDASPEKCWRAMAAAGDLTRPR